MASRNFQRVQAASKEAKLLFAHITIGASGAPTLSASQSLGVASISRTSAGLYVLTLSDTYNSLLHVQAVVQNSSVDDIQLQIKSEDVDGAKTITFNTKAPTDASTTTQVVADPADGTVLRLMIWVKNTNVL
jgi:ATP phosphoribosyltransferase